MSARVVIPAPLRGLRHTRVSSACNAVSSASYPASSVKRDLFGPVNHEETRQFVEQELESYQDECRTKWNFDFIDEIPYTGRYEWKLTVERPGRRAEKRQRNDDDVNNEHLYYEPEDDPLPTPAKRTYSTTTPPLKGQTKITDFLKVKKEAVSHQDKSKKESTVLDNTPSWRPDRSLQSTNIKRWSRDCRT